MLQLTGKRSRDLGGYVMKVRSCGSSLIVLALQTLTLAAMTASPTAFGELIIVSTTQSVSSLGSAYYEYNDFLLGQVTEQDQFDLTSTNSVSGQATAGGRSSYGLASVSTTTTPESISGASYVEAYAYLDELTDRETFDEAWSGRAESYAASDMHFTLTTPFTDPNRMGCDCKQFRRVQHFGVLLDARRVGSCFHWE